MSVLIEGYVKDDTQVVPTTTLIRDGDVSIVVDPGMGKNKSADLSSSLVKHDLTFESVNFVFATHYHLDHTVNIGLFPNATVVDNLYTCKGYDWLEHEGDGWHILPCVAVMHTPGHGSMFKNTSAS